MDKKKSGEEIECLNKQVNCIYQDIGCDVKLYSRDLHSHEESHQAKHMKLIYQNLIDCKKQLSASGNEITLLKQENATLRKKLEKTELSSSIKTAQLTYGLETITIEFYEYRQENYFLLEKLKREDENENTKKKFKLPTSSIDYFKSRLCQLQERITVVNNEDVLILRHHKRRFGLNIDKLSNCYERKNFNYVFDSFALEEEKSLLLELLDKIPYHLYEDTESYDFFALVFPLDLRNIKANDILVQDKFKMSILNNEICVELLCRQRECRKIKLYIGKYELKLQDGIRFNLEKLQDSQHLAMQFTLGYAILFSYIRGFWL